MSLSLHLHATKLALHLKTLASYSATMRSNVRALWTGTWDIFDFSDAMVNSVMAGLTAAWNEGLESVGATSADVSPEERQALRLLIDSELANVDGFGDFIEANSKANKGNLQTCFDRLELWLNRYDQVFDMGALAGAKPTDNFIWELGQTEKHCDTCAALDGIVASKADWDASGLHPKNPPNARLECGGWRCDCRRTPTNEPATEGGIPNV